MEAAVGEVSTGGGKSGFNSDSTLAETTRTKAQHEMLGSGMKSIPRPSRMQKDSSTPQSRSFLLVWPFILEPSTACFLCILMAQMAALSRPGLQFILRGTRKVDICLVLVAIHTTAFAHIGGEYPPNFGAGMSGTCQVQADGFPSFAVNGSLIMEETRCTSHRVDERACWLLVGYLCPYRITFLNRVISTHR